VDEDWRSQDAEPEVDEVVVPPVEDETDEE
jgi:hypothetical protein